MVEFMFLLIWFLEMFEVCPFGVLGVQDVFSVVSDLSWKVKTYPSCQLVVSLLLRVLLMSAAVRNLRRTSESEPALPLLR
jgi:hypothetical protein